MFEDFSFHFWLYVSFFHFWNMNHYFSANFFFNLVICVHVSLKFVDSFNLLFFACTYCWKFRSWTALMGIEKLVNNLSETWQNLIYSTKKHLNSLTCLQTSQKQDVKITNSKSQYIYIYTHTRKSHEYFTNGKFQLSYIECTSKKSNNQFLQNIMFNQIKCPTSCEINEQEIIQLLTSIIKIWNIPIISCFSYERLCFLNIFQLNCQKTFYMFSNSNKT
jgi:hypothetical protein